METPKETPKKKTPKKKTKFSAVLFTADKPTADGRIYPMAVLQKTLERFTKKPIIIVQEMNPVERKVKKVPLAEPWSKKVMANVLKGEIVDNDLIFYAECRANRDGRKLAGIIKSIGLENVHFFPVGYGVVDDKNVIDPTYQLNYISVEPKK